MTAQSVALGPTSAQQTRGSLFLGFGTIFRKEVAEWVRGRRALVVAAVMVPIAVLSTIAPFLMPEDQAAAAAASGYIPSWDATVNVLTGWSGAPFAMIALLAAITLMTVERDRGTLGWTLTNPVSRTSVIAAKWAAGLLVYGAVGVVLPVVTSVVAASVAFGELPDLGTVAVFTALFLMVPAFWIALMVGLGTIVKSTAGVAGIGLLVLFLPIWLASFLPVIGELSPTSVGGWAIAIASGHAASSLTLGGWIAGMVAMAVSSKLIFDRQEF
jgi:ABC-2 type transport system permease protein